MRLDTVGRHIPDPPTGTPRRATPLGVVEVLKQLTEHVPLREDVLLQVSRVPCGHVGLPPAHLTSVRQGGTASAGRCSSTSTAGLARLVLQRPYDLNAVAFASGADNSCLPVVWSDGSGGLIAELAGR